MEEDGGDGEDLTTPFWVQSTTNVRRSDRLRRGVSAVLFSSGLVVFLLLVMAAFFLVFVVPSTVSFSATIFRPNSVKKSWDSLNIVLVLVAVLFGFLSRGINEERSSSYDEFQPSPIKQNEPPKSNPSTPTKWFNYSTNDDQKSNIISATNQWYEFQDSQPKFEQKNSSLRRSSSSYPDLREFPSSSSSSTHWSYGDYHERRFFDDFQVDSGRSSDPSQLHHHRRHRSLGQFDYLTSPPQTKTVIVDTLVSKSAEASNIPVDSSSPPQAVAAAAGEDESAMKVINESEAVRKERPSRRFYKDMEISNPVAAPKPPLPPSEESPPPEFEESHKRSRERALHKKERLSRRQYRDMEPTNPIPTTPPPPQAPVPPPPPPPPPPQDKSSKSERRRGSATGSSTKDFLNSLYNNKKKKKQRQKSVENMDSLLHEAQPPLTFQIPPSPPPPPPPLPPPSVFHTLFSSKKQKRKRTITVTLEPLPPSPPPASPPRELEPTPRAAPLPSHKPPKPVKMMNNFDRLDEASNSGGESPLSRIPPPPPPPPPSFLKTPAWKFVVQGDYVRVNSNNSSRSGSPDLDEADSDVTPSASDGGDASAFHPSPLFCPSPDVNTKAESFITNFRAKLKLEKIHSMKRGVGPSSLGPGPGPSPKNNI